MTATLRGICGALMFALATLAWGGAGAATDPIAATRTARADLAQASARLRNAQEASDRVAALTGVVRAYDSALSRIREGLVQISAREHALTAELDARSAEIADLLGVLSAMGRTKGPVTLLHPTGPLGTARGGMMLADLTPALEREASHLRAQLEEVDALRAAQTKAIESLEAGLMDATRARADLSAAISDRGALPRRYADDPVQAALVEASTSSLAALSNALADLGGAGDLPLAQDLRGALGAPVEGQVIAGFGTRAQPGGAKNGVHIATAPRAIVSMPVPATLRFQGPLLDFGTVVVIEPAADILMIFAGLDQVFGSVGEVLPEGTPLGQMGGTPEALTEILAAQGGEPRRETLYIEVRENGTAVDPADWFEFELQEAGTP